MSQTARRTIVSGDAAVLARRYADALYDLAEDEKAVDAIAADLRSLLQTVDQNPDLMAAASNPRLNRSQLAGIVRSLADALKLNKLTGKFLALTAQRQRLTILPAIADAFLARLAAQRGEMTISVRSASPLTAHQSEQLAARLASLAGGKVTLDVREDKSLIGGLTVRFGSRLIDTSVKSKLQRLERKLKSDAA